MFNFILPVFLHVKLLTIIFIMGLTAECFGISFSSSEVNLNIAPGFNHVPLRISANSSAPNLSAVSNVSWVSASVDQEKDEVILNFTTSELITSSNRATITVSDDSGSASFTVNITLSILNITKLIDDPRRSRVYGIQQNGTGTGSIIAMEPISNENLWCMTVGEKPTDFSITPDGNEILVINSVSENIIAIDLNTREIIDTFELPYFTNWGQSTTTCDIEAGPDDLIYYTDASWAPVLHVYDRSSRTVLQTITDGSNGIGDFAFNHNFTQMYAWKQYGWSAGSAGTYFLKYNVSQDGTLSFSTKTASDYPALQRDPFDTPVFVDNTHNSLFIKTRQVSSIDISTVENTYPSDAYSISPNGELVATKAGIYETQNGVKLLDLTGNPTVQTITSDYARFVYFDNTEKTLKTINLISEIGLKNMGANITPENEAIVTSPASLSWSPILGVECYRVYLGTSEQAVTDADIHSPLYLGEVDTNSITLNSKLLPNTTYFWRFDPVFNNGFEKGIIYTFTVSLISSSHNNIEAETVEGHANWTTHINLTAATSEDWQISSNADWISFDKENGQTPSTIEVTLDASSLTEGEHTSGITLANSNGTLFSIPVTINVAAMNLTMFESDRNSPLVYTISGGTSISDKAYLLEVNTLTEEILRVVPVGYSVTDLCLHEEENTIYIANWKENSIRTIDRNTFTPSNSFACSNVYKLAAGVFGRLIVSTDNYNAKLIDTANGTILNSSSGLSEGDGVFNPANKRYYYHGESGNSGASLNKMDLTADIFTKLKEVRTTSAGYYGSNIIQISDDGELIFWNGTVFNSDLSIAWDLGELIHSTSSDGHYAFTEEAIYDVTTTTYLMDMPVPTTISGFNDITGKLLYKTDNNTIGYLKLSPENKNVSPTGSAIITSPDELQWESVQTATAYQIYLGTDRNQVEAATPSSELYLGTANTNTISVPSTLVPGIYFWRIDSVTPYGTVSSAIHTFQVAELAISVAQLDVTTVRGDRHYQATIDLSVPGDATNWQAQTDAPWISFDQSSGVTPATLTLTIDTTGLNAGNYSTEITFSGDSSTYFSIPVTLQLLPLNLTIIESDPETEFSYAVNTNATTELNTIHLLEINTQSEKITRVTKVDASAIKDLVIHKGDNRIYVSDWKAGNLLAFDLDSFQEVRKYPFSPAGPMGSSSNDVYAISAGAPGRLIIEEEDQWISISIFDTNTGTKLASRGEREGNGVSTKSGRYYFHGDNNSSGAEIHKYDLMGDSFNELATTRVTSVSGYGSRIIRASSDGERIAWNGVVFDKNLNTIYDIGETIYGLSANGRYAFTKTEIYDTVSNSYFADLPASITVQTHNGNTEKLIFQSGDALSFYHLADPFIMQTSQLSLKETTNTSMTLEWSVVPFATGFVLQVKESGALQWQDVNITLNAETTEAVINDLIPMTSYDFRLMASNSSISSVWSNILTAEIVIPPPVAPEQLSLNTVGARQIDLQWSDVENEVSYQLERCQPQVAPNAWILVAEIPLDINVYQDKNLSPETEYQYRLTVLNQAGASVPLLSDRITTPTLQAPRKPQLGTITLDEQAVTLQWNTVTDAENYLIYRKDAQSDTWQQIEVVSGDLNYYVDSNVQGGTSYEYMIVAQNAVGSSENSESLTIEVREESLVLHDDFNEVINNQLWSVIDGAQHISGGPDGNGHYLYFYGSARTLETVNFTILGEATLSFDLRAGNEYVDGPAWNNSETGENVVIQYFDGNTWQPLETLDTVYPGHRTWQHHELKLPETFLGDNLRLRWTQSTFSANFDHWAIDNVSLVYTIPLPPTPPTLVISGRSTESPMTIFWIPVDAAQFYLVERTADNGETWEEVAQVDAPSAYYQDPDVSLSHSFQYRVIAGNDGGLSAPSNGRQLPGTPQISQVMAADYTVALNWTNVSHETIYIIERTLADQNHWEEIATTRADETDFTDRTVMPQTAYSYRIKAQNNVGSSTYSDLETISTQMVITTDDLDQDGLPNNWEEQYFFTLDQNADGDYDGDGFSNSQEFINGTNPASYVLKLTAGWNLCAISRQPVNNSIKALLGSNILGQVWTWQDGNYLQVDELEPLKGYWIYANEDFEVEIKLK